MNAFAVHKVKINGGCWPDQPVVGRASDAQMFQRFDKRRDADSACNLRDHAWALRHFGDHVRAETGSVTAAQELVIKNRIGFTGWKYPGLVPQYLIRDFMRCPQSMSRRKDQAHLQGA